MKYFFIFCATFLSVCIPTLASAETQEGQTFARAEVVSVHEEEVTGSDGERLPFQRVELDIVSGSEKGQHVIVNHGLQVPLEAYQRVEEGDTVVVDRSYYEDTGVRYYIVDQYRLPRLAFIAALFFACAIYFGRWKGVLSIIGMAFSIAVIFYGIIPLIAKGHSPLLVSSLGAFLILLVSLYLSHGFLRRTSIALASSAIILLFGIGIDVVFSAFAHIFGFGSEEAMYLSFQTHQINPQGIFLGGVILGVLGIIDDVTTAQTAAVEEIYRADSSLSVKDLYRRGLSVGKEHIASLINTLVLAYVGASFPLFVLANIQQTGELWLVLNSQFFAEEIVRTLVGSTALVMAVPLTTAFAAYVYTKKGVDPGDAIFAAHTHRH